MTDSIDTSEREAEDPREPIRLPVREMRDEPVPHQAADPLRAALQLALEATPEELPAALSAVRAALAAQQAGVQVPPGYKLVPVEPTEAMVAAIGLNDGSSGRYEREAWAAMLAAAPEAPAQAEPCAHTGKTYEAHTGDGTPVEFCSECHKAVSVGGRPTQAEAPSEREAFEAWWFKEATVESLENAQSVESECWLAWQAGRADLASQPQAEAVLALKEGPRSMETAPKDSSIVRLLVEFDEHSFEDDNAPVWTIGTNHLNNNGIDEWLFAGWSWEHDCFTQGVGKAIGWLPMLGDIHPPTQASQPQAVDAEDAGVVVSAYRIGDGLDAIKVERVMQLKGDDLWAVRLHSRCLNKLGEWEWEPLPSSRDDAFLLRCRFETARAAIDAARRAGGAA